MSNEEFLFSSVYKLFKDWADDTANSGDNITDLALNSINRAQRVLRRLRKWEELEKRETLSIVDRVASLPSDIGELHWIGEVDASGRVKRYYYQNSNDDSKSYRINNIYSQAAPSTQTLTFVMSPSGPIQVAYTQKLNDFTSAQAADGADPVYFYFPGELMFQQAKVLYLLDGDMIDDELKAAKDMLEDLVGDFEDGHQYVNYDLKLDILDGQGQVMGMEVFDLDNGSGHSSSRRSNSFDDR